MGDQQWKVNTKDRKALQFDDAKEREWTGPFFFVQGADCQFGLISEHIEKQSVVTWEKEIALVEALVERINRMEPPPRFVVVCGDLVHAFPGTPDRVAQEKDFKSLFGRIRSDVPLLCVCGNHDAGNIPTPQTIEGFHASFGDEYYSFLCGGVLFLVINSQYLFDGSGAPAQVEEHSAWLDATLEKAQQGGIKRIVVFQHIPWFLERPDEPDDAYFALRQTVREAWLPKLQAAGVEAIFCGHYHRNAGGSYNGMPVVVTSAIGGQLGDDKSGARIVSVHPERILHKYYAIDELPLENSPVTDSNS